MWPGSEDEEKLPNFYLPFSPLTTIYQKFNQVFDWYQKYNIQFFMVYIPQVDQIGHEFGTDSVQVR